MPPRGRYPKRKTRRRRSTRKMTRASIPKSKVYNFTRVKEQLLVPEEPNFGATNWLTTFDNAIVKTFTFGLSELPGYSEFTGLFAEYKLNAASVKFYPGYSQVASTSGTTVTNNIIITVWPNTTGTGLTAAFTKEQLNEIQRKRQWMFPLTKPTTVYMPLNQLNQVYASATNTDYTVLKPKYISTTETNTPHYGMNVHIQKIDNTAFGTDSVRMKILEKIYVSCRQVV